MVKDFAELSTETTDNSQLSDLNRLAEEQVKAEIALEEAQKVLNKAQQDLKEINERRLPEAMEAIGIKEFTTQNGLKITIKDIVRASIPKNHAHEALEWLRTNGAESLIKNNVVMTFGRGQDEQVEKLVAEMLERFGDQTVAHNEGVHAQTLSKYVRECLEEGKEIPLELLGVYQGKQSVVKRRS